MKCKFCELTSYNLERHVKIHHNQKCDKCEKTFLSEKELDEHFIQNHVDKGLSNKLIKQTQSVLSGLK